MIEELVILSLSELSSDVTAGYRLSLQASSTFA
jgi:hypothetical protein